MSSALPGSWPPNWLHGKPITVKPLGSYFFWSASSVAYWGVFPHCDATLTSISALPLYAASVVGWPLSVLIGTFHIAASSLVMATCAGAVPAGGRFLGSNIVGLISAGFSAGFSAGLAAGA